MALLFYKIFSFKIDPLPPLWSCTLRNQGSACFNSCSGDTNRSCLMFGMKKKSIGHHGHWFIYSTFLLDQSISDLTAGVVIIKDDATISACSGKEIVVYQSAFPVIRSSKSRGWHMSVITEEASNDSTCWYWLTFKHHNSKLLFTFDSSNGVVD